MKTNFFALVGLMVFSFSSILIAQKTTLGGVDVPKTYSFNNKELVLNGSSIREKFFIDIYIGSLYLEAKNSNAKQIITSENDMGFRIKIVSGLLTSAKMKAGVKESFGKVAKQYPVAVKSLTDFLNLFNDKIVSGDEFFLAYTSLKGLMVYKNGKLIGSVKDLTVKKALFATWLSNAISKDFTSNVLNGN